MEKSLEALSMKAKALAYYEKYMLLMGILGQMLFYIQGFKILMTESAAGVSLGAFYIGLVSSSSWLLYGFLLNNRPLVLSNLVGVLGAVFVIVGIVVYS